jgi:MFS superfamily sulfate permease-like transporter
MHVPVNKRTSSLRDVVAGISVAGLMLPEAVAYAGIAGLAPGRAILAAIVGSAVYAIAGQSRFAIVAPTSSSAAILAAALATLSGTAIDKSLLATAITGVVGAAFLLMALLRLGGVAAFISRPVLRGFAFGLAVTIIARQMPTLLGLEIHTPSFAALVVSLVTHIGQTNLFTLAIGGIALASLLLLRRYTKLPGSLFVLLAGIALASLVDLPRHGVALVGPITLVAARPTLPDYGPAEWSRIVQLTLPLMLILFAESWGTMRALALRTGDTLSGNHELAALGGANILAALAQGMPVGAGFSAGSASEAAGATTRLTCLVASLGLAAMILLAAPAVARIPEPVLAAVVIAALTHALTPGPIIRLFRIDRDQWIALAAALGVIAFGVLDGMLLAVALSVGALLHRLAAPKLSELGRMPGSHDFVDMTQHADAVAVNGVAIFRPNAPLFFANADSIVAQVAAESTQRPASIAIVLSLEESDDLDSSAVEALAELTKTLAAQSKTLHLARVHDRSRAVLNAAGMNQLADLAGFSVADAVAGVNKRKGKPHA